MTEIVVVTDKLKAQFADFVGMHALWAARELEYGQLGAHGMARLAGHMHVALGAYMIAMFSQDELALDAVGAEIKVLEKLIKAETDRVLETGQI